MRMQAKGKKAKQYNITVLLSYKLCLSAYYLTSPHKDSIGTVVLVFPKHVHSLGRYSTHYG